MRCSKKKQKIIDSTHYGNISRFINHACVPNLRVHPVIIDSPSNDLSTHHIALFAIKNIEKGEELTLDYAVKLHGEPDGSASWIPCLCRDNCPTKISLIK